EPADQSRQTLSTCGGEGETNASGGFVITWLGNGTYDMYIDGSGAGLPSRFIERAITVTNATNASVTAQDYGTIAFDAPGYIRGNVTRSSDGGDVVGADVSAFQPCGPDGCSGGGGGWGQTDSAGAYSLALSPGNYGMYVQTGWQYSGPALSPARVDCGDFVGAECINVSAGNTQWRDFVLEAGATISGRIMTPGNSTPARAFINAESCQEGMGSPGSPPPCQFAWGQTDWDGSGNFSIVVQPGTWRLRIEPDRYNHPDLSTLVIEGVVVGEGATVDLGQREFTGGGAIAGTVVDGDGEPVPFVNVFANVHVDDPFGGFGGFGGFGWSDENGQFTIGGLAPGAYDLFVEPGYGSEFMRTEVRNIAVNASETTELTIEVSAGGTLRGYVRTGDGTPIANAFVDAFWQPEQEPGAPGPGPGMPPASGGWGHDMTDANGLFEIRGLTNGTFGMFVRPPFGTSYTSDNLDPFHDDLPQVSIGGTTWQNFTLSAGGQITGCVVASGSPVPFAWVSAFSRTSGFGGGEPTQSNGCFTIRGVAPGTYEIEVNPPFGSKYGRTRVENIVVSAGETTDAGEIQLSAGVRLAGRVLDAGGNPLPGIFVNAFQIGEPGAGPGAFAFGITNGDGEYNLSGLAAGKYGMHVQPPFGESSHSSKFIPEVQVNGTGRYGYDITLGGGGWITGTVLGPDGAALRGAWVNAWSFNGGSGAGAMTGDDGSFNLSGLSAASDYNFDVFPPWDRQNLAGHHAFPVTVTEGAGTDMGTIQLTSGGTLVGRVEDGSGNAVEFAFINVNGNGTFGWGMTDEDGNFSVQGLRASAGDTLSIFVQ
ncbi:MAG: carboxypeptidase regulatory-like domain-containing protein, partial [Vicinamibacteria bacterium]